MKVFKRTLSVCVAFVLALSAIAAPITASATTPETISGLTSVQASDVSAETLHPFTSTEALIRDAIEELRAMEITHTEKEPDKALVNAVEKSAEMTYETVKDTIGELLQGLFVTYFISMTNIFGDDSSQQRCNVSVLTKH